MQRADHIDPATQGQPRFHEMLDLSNGSVAIERMFTPDALWPRLEEYVGAKRRSHGTPCMPIYFGRQVNGLLPSNMSAPNRLDLLNHGLGYQEGEQSCGDAQNEKEATHISNGGEDRARGQRGVDAVFFEHQR